METDLVSDLVTELETELGYPAGELRCVGYFDWYEIHDRRRLEAVLADLEGVSPGGEGGWVWYVGSGRDRRLVAELRIEGDGDSLVLETQGEKDADRCGSLLKRAARGSIEFRIGEVRHVHVPSKAADGE